MRQLIIRDAQMRAFGRARWEAFVTAITERAREEVSEVRGVSHDALRSLLASSAADASAYGFIDTEHVERFCLAAARLGASPATLPDLRDVVADFTVAPGARLEAIERAAEA